MTDILYYQQSNGEIPYKTFLEKIRDKRIRSRITLKVEATLACDEWRNCERLPCGDRHVRKIKFVGKSSELGGYRVYFGVFDNDVIVVLNAGGKNKKGQQNKDIKQAEKFYDDFISRRDSHD